MADLADLERRLWETADELRANSKLRASEYGTPVLGLIFLRFADARFQAARSEVEAKATTRRKVKPDDYKQAGLVYLPPEAQFSQLLALPEGTDLGRALNDAMRAIERDNPDLAGVLPKTYTTLDNDTIVNLLRLMASIPDSIEGDAFGLIYEYFLGKFAFAEGAKGGEFFTPTSIVRLIVEIIEPFHGKILDPACGSGGMFVQSAHFVERHRKRPTDELSIYGQERVTETVRLARMNLAVHGLTGQIREGNTYYEDLNESVGTFDFVMANPPFNVDKVDKAKLEGDPRFPYGLPNADNANYLWMQVFASALNKSGRAGFVMANSAADAQHSESQIRRKMIEERLVDVMIAVGPNFFYTVPLSCTLWFLDRGKRDTSRQDTVLFLDARDVFRQVDRAHRDFTDPHIELFANIVRRYRSEAPEHEHEPDPRWEPFTAGHYVDLPGLCRVATVAEIEAQGWSLNPGRYVGTQTNDSDNRDFKERLQVLHDEFNDLSERTAALEKSVRRDIEDLLR